MPQKDQTLLTNHTQHKDNTTQNIVRSERATQNRVIDLLCKFNDYSYIGNLQDKENKPYIEKITKEFLTKQQGCTEKQASAVVRKLKNAVAQCTTQDSLYNANKEIYHLLRYPTSVSQGLGAPNKQVSVIDWQHPENNLFHIAEEVTVARTGDTTKHRRPDVVIYINGIAVAIIELKKATVSALDGIKQQIRNQEDGQIAPFFATAQLLLAGSESEGVFYGTTLTKQKYYLRWKEPAGQNYAHPTKQPTPYKTKFPPEEFKNELNRALLQMLEPARLLEFIHDCIVFDGGIKKVARPNQYFAIQAAKTRIRERENGIIWHSQGSGKSLTMVWLAQWILENIDNSRVVIITDREELDIQITNGFVDAGHKPIRATSGEHLINMLNGTNNRRLGKGQQEPAKPALMTTLLHKFGIAGNPDDESESPGESPRPTNRQQPENSKNLKGKRSPEQYMQEIAEHLPEGFTPKGQIFVFVDECHRTQGGLLNKAMKKIMGEGVMLIGFTGTPLLKSEKQRLTSREAFGPWISTYKFDEAVSDGIVLDLRYEARNVEQNLSNANDFDALFECHTEGLTPKAKERIQERWALMQHIFSSRDRVQRIVAQIYKDFIMIPCLREGWGNAILVADSIYQAFRFWEAFEGNDYFKGHTAVITSYGGEDIALEEGFSGELRSEAEFKHDMFEKMVGEKTGTQYEEYAKDEFINHPGSMRVLIVVDKLLTGFDAPAATYMYIDKSMKDHTLFQAICRVNRTNDERKQYGYIIDYKNLFKHIKGAMEDYTSGGFEAFDKTDIKGLLKGRLSSAKKDLEEAIEKIKHLSEPVLQPKTLDEYFDYFCYNQAEQSDAAEQQAQILSNTQRREAFYDACHNLVRRYVAIATEMGAAGFSKEQAQSIYETVKDYDHLRLAILHRSGDYIDFKAYDAEMRALLDDYITASRVEVLEKLDDFSFLDIIKVNADDSIEGVDHDAEEELGGQKGVVETLFSSTRRVINRKRDSNPEEYKYFSERINRLIEEYHQETIEYKQFLQEVNAIIKDLKANQNVDSRINTSLKKALYDNLGKSVEFTLAVYKVIEESAQIGFREHPNRRKKLKKAIAKALEETKYNAEDVLNIVIHNKEF